MSPKVRMLALAAIFLVAACMYPEAERYGYGIKDMAPDLSFEQSGVVEISEGNTVSLTIRKSMPVYSATVRLVPFNDKELANVGYRGLAPGQCSYPEEVFIGENNDSVEIEVCFDITESFVSNRKYAVGFHLVSDNEKLPASADGSDIIIHISAKTGSALNPHKLQTPEDLMSMSSLLQTYAYQPVCFRLMNDIDMSGYSWIPLDPTGERPIFFEGGGHTISNLTCVATPSSIIEAPSFFAYLWGTCQNVTFKNPKIVSYYKKTGVVAGTVGLVGWGRDHDGHLKNVHVVGGSVVHYVNNTWVGWTGQAGGLAGELCHSGSTIEGCSSSASVKSDYCAGGIVGQANDASLIDCCEFTGTVSAGSTVAKGNALEEVFLDPSGHGTNIKWGIAGGIVAIAYNVALTNCKSSGVVRNTDSSYGFAGGIVGMAYMGVNAVENSISTARVAGAENAGGIIGTNGNYKSGGNYIRGCIAWNSSVESLKHYPGRICGLMSSNKTGGKASYGENCYAKQGMSLRYMNGEFTLSSQTINATDQMNTESGPQYYQGIESSDVIATARDKLGWDSAKWDFSGNEPELIL